MIEFTEDLNSAKDLKPEKSLTILYVAMKYDYGKAEQGYSFEHYNFYESLKHMGHTLLYFDFMSLMQEHGKEWMNRKLLEVVKAEKPDLMFTFLFMDELDQDTLRFISNNTDTITLNWFADDHWRFDHYSSQWAPCFNWVVTTAQSALPKYEKIGYANVIKSQWACNHFLYQNLNLSPKYDITFVGQPHGDRTLIIETLRQEGLKVNVWGKGWETGRISQQEMIQVFNTSRINLNLTNSIDLNFLNPTTATPPRNLLQRAVSRLKRSIPINSSLPTPPEIKQPFIPQIKGRNFEIPGCGGFLLTSYADNLEDYYSSGQEVVCFDSVSDLISKAKYFLAHEDERCRIAKAGLQRTLNEHTYIHRFDQIFQQMGMTHHNYPLNANNSETVVIY
jgi:spore maturation protein CgeB